MPLIPTPHHIIVKLKEQEATTDSGLIISKAHQQPSDRAIVVALPRIGAPEGVEIADTVLLTSAWAGANIEHEGVTYVAVLVDEVLAVLE